MISDKKILITTVYNSENCGSFLQAWSLYRVLTQRGYEVAFLKRNSKHTSHSFGLHLLNASKDIIKLRFSHAFSVMKEWFVFDKLQKQFRIAKKNSLFFKNASIQIIGSDTLWNFEDDYFKKMADTYLGREFFPKSSMTYAISAANTSIELFAKIANVNAREKYIKNFLVRDLHTANLVKMAFDEESYVVCDPTMLLSPSDFIILEKAKPAIEEYLLIYCFTDIVSMKNTILSYAKDRGLKTVSFITKRDWCDYSVEEDPQLMVTYFRHAKCVVSNTFHGTALSLIFRRPFVVFDEGKNKVNELLKMYRQEERLISSPESLKAGLDLAITEQDIQNFESIRQQSMTILLNSINNEINRENKI